MTDTAWEELLDRFEQDLDDATTIRRWTRPDQPLPEHLTERAQRVWQRQQEQLHRMSAVRDDLHRQLVALRRIPPTRGDTPALLDRDL
ncbi:hypothetical protein [Microbacterium sp.]|uniref:hypothetical protein n=1 Tax=Microbacterium sp. TaxID=51671 RepID=UPI003A9056E4